MRRTQDKLLCGLIIGLLAINLIQGLFNAALYALVLYGQYQFQGLIDAALRGMAG